VRLAWARFRIQIIENHFECVSERVDFLDRPNSRTALRQSNSIRRKYLPTDAFITLCSSATHLDAIDANEKQDSKISSCQRGCDGADDEHDKRQAKEVGCGPAQHDQSGTCFTGHHDSDRDRHRHRADDGCRG
jgi:hypothetical protein